eukprot:jgi/Tetstr1/434410/TSEL_023510.t1
MRCLTTSTARRALATALLPRPAPHRLAAFTAAQAATGKMPTIALFDVDGTLTVPRSTVEQKMLDFIAKLRKKVTVGIVGGSDLVKIKEQLGEGCTASFDYTFSENGLLAMKGDAVIAQQSFKDHIGEDNLKKLLNFILHYIADLDIPIKRGTFIEFRNGMLNVSPIGRNCSREERNEFEKFDEGAGVRKAMVAVLEEKFAHLGLKYSIGGQISFDVFPVGWDKTYCLQFVEKEFDTIHFFGDKTYEGGNDFEIFSSPKTIGHTVTSPEDTIQQCTELFSVESVE